MWNLLPSLNLALVAQTSDSPSLGGSSGPDLTRYFMVCGVLILATVAVAWGLRKVITGNLRQRTAQRSLQIVDVLGLGGKRKLAVVRCYDRTFVVGLGEREISPIAELDPVIGSDLPQPAASKADDKAFAQALEQVSKAMPAQPVATKVVTPQPARSQPRTEAAPRKVLVKRRKVKTKSSKAPTQRRSQGSQEDRKREAQAVASAARQIAEDKLRVRRSQADDQDRTTATGRPLPVKCVQSAKSPAPEVQAPEPSLRLEGIIG